jgi:hypothetical protein
LEREKEKEKEKVRGVTLRRGEKEMGEAMDRAKDCVHNRSHTRFQKLATLHPGCGRGSTRSNKWTSDRAFQLFI